MEKIIFKDIDNQALRQLKEVFEELKEGKRSGRINVVKIKNIIGPLHNSKFSHPVDSEEPWSFESWIEAMQNADVTLFEIKVHDGSQYELSLHQNSWPSGGIEAMEKLVKIFDAEIVENTMI